MIIGRATIDAALLRAKRLPKSTLTRKRNLDFIPQKDRREGPRVCYSLAPDSPAIQPLRAFLRDVLPTSETFQADLKVLSNLESSGRLKSLGLRIVAGPTDRAAPASVELEGVEDADARAA